MSEQHFSYKEAIDFIKFPYVTPWEEEKNCNTQFFSFLLQYAMKKEKESLQVKVGENKIIC